MLLLGVKALQEKAVLELFTHLSIPHLSYPTSTT